MGGCGTSEMAGVCKGTLPRFGVERWLDSLKTQIISEEPSWVRDNLEQYCISR